MLVVCVRNIQTLEKDRIYTAKEEGNFYKILDDNNNEVNARKEYFKKLRTWR